MVEFTVDGELRWVGEDSTGLRDELSDGVAGSLMRPVRRRCRREDRCAELFDCVVDLVDCGFESTGNSLVRGERCDSGQVQACCEKVLHDVVV